MKNLTLLLFLSLTLFLGCSKKDSDQLNPNTGIQNVQTPAAPGVYQIKIDKAGINSIAKVDFYVDQKPKSQGPQFASKEDHHQLKCDFKLLDGIRCHTDIHSEVDKDKIHGKIKIDDFFDCDMDAICLQVDGDEAIFSGVITKVKNPGPIPQFILVGNTLVFRVKDNGHGHRALPDQVSSVLYIWVPAQGAFPCVHEWFTEVPWYDYLNVMPHGRIEVK